MSTTSEVQTLYIGLLARAADPDGLAYWVGEIDAGTLTLEQLRSNIVNEQAEYLNGLGTYTRSQLVNALYENMFERGAGTEGLDYWVDGGGSTVPADSLVLALDNAAKGTDRLTLDNKVTAATYYTANTLQAAYTNALATASVSDVDSTEASVTASKTATDDGGTGETFTLTTAADTFTGGSGVDTFNGVIDATTAANNTFTILDTLIGGTGNDTLNIIANAYANNDANPAASVSGIQTINIRAIDATTTDTFVVNTANFSGATAFNSDRSSSEITLNNLVAGSTVGIIGNAVATQAILGANYVVGATAGVLNVSGGTLGTAALAMNGTGLTTLTIGSTGVANVVGSITTNSAVVTGVTINAATALSTGGIVITNSNTGITTEALTISGAADDLAATATAGARSAVVLGAIDTDFGSVDASGLTTGGVSATLSSTLTATFTGGNGNDTLSTSTSAQSGAVNGGAGTDTLVLTAAADIDTTAEGALYQGFEVLSSAAAAIDMDLITGSTITAIVLGAAGSNVTDMTATQAANITANGVLGISTLSIKNATTVGNKDSMTITSSDGDTTTGESNIAAADITMAGVETLTIIATDNVDFNDMSNITGLTDLNISGPGNVDIITLGHVITTNESIDFTGLTGTSTFNAAGALTNAFAFTGGSGVDTVTSSAIGGSVFTLKAGDDTMTVSAITGGTVATTVNGGAGADTTTLTVIGSDAQEAVVFVYAAGDSVSDTSTSGISATLTDDIIGIDSIALAAGSGNKVTFQTEVNATAVSAGTTDVALGTTAVTNAYDFFVNIDAAATTWVYQDTDGDKIIEAGEFAVALTGVTGAIMAAGEFAIVTGDLVYTAA